MGRGTAEFRSHFLAEAIGVRAAAPHAPPGALVNQVPSCLAAIVVCQYLHLDGSLGAGDGTGGRGRSGGRSRGRGGRRRSGRRTGAAPELVRHFGEELPARELRRPVHEDLVFAVAVGAADTVAVTVLDGETVPRGGETVLVQVGGAGAAVGTRAAAGALAPAAQVGQGPARLIGVVVRPDPHPNDRLRARDGSRGGGGRGRAPAARGDGVGEQDVGDLVLGLLGQELGLRLELGVHLGGGRAGAEHARGDAGDICGGTIHDTRTRG